MDRREGGCQLTDPTNQSDTAVRIAVPLALRNAAKSHHADEHKLALEAAAVRCQVEGTLESIAAAAFVAEAAAASAKRAYHRYATSAIGSNASARAARARADSARREDSRFLRDFFRDCRVSVEDRARYIKAVPVKDNRARQLHNANFKNAFTAAQETQAALSDAIAAVRACAAATRAVRAADGKAGRNELPP